MIPIYVPSYNRAQTIKTTRWLDESGLTYKVLLHTDKCADAYLQAGIIRASDVIVTHAPRGITNQRNWMTRNLAKVNEWYISLDDNISHLKKVVDKYYGRKTLNVNDPNINQADFNDKLTARDWLGLLEKDILIADTIGSEYIGFATVDNYFFNSKKYKPVGYVISKAVAIKYAGLRYDDNLEAMEDFGYCAAQLVKNNCVLINSWIKPVAGHYEPGGIGTYEQRVPRKIVDCEYLMRKYPGLFRYKIKKDCHPRAELQIRFHSPDQIIKWKAEYKITNEIY